MNKEIHFWIGALCGAVVMFLIAAYSIRAEVNAEQSRAISAGVARWTINPATGERAFSYIKPEEKKP